jgi:hypothetical protein
MSNVVFNVFFSGSLICVKFFEKDSLLKRLGIICQSYFSNKQVIFYVF